MSAPPEKERPPLAATSEGQPITVGASGNAPFAHCNAADKPNAARQSNARGRRAIAGAEIAYRAPTGLVWRYRGKRGRVLAMLASNPGGLTQWDTLPWHTRLGGTIHAMRRDGLAIDTEREGEYRHARYRLATPGQLVGAASRKGGAA